jgi:hypothetical protein
VPVARIRTEPEVTVAGTAAAKPARCIGYHDYPVSIDMAGVAHHVCVIPEYEFGEAWLRSRYGTR